MYCPKCYQKIGGISNFCKYCGTSLGDLKKIKTPEPSGGNFWWGFLSFFEPIVGFIFFGVWCKKRPRRAKVCGVNALVSIALALFLLTPTIIEFAKKINPPAPPATEEMWHEWFSYPFYDISGYEFDGAVFENSEDGRLVFHKIIESASVRFDEKGDFVAAWRGNMIKIYENFEEKFTLRYDESSTKRKVEVFGDSPQRIADVALHNGKLAVAFLGLEKKIVVHDLRTLDAKLFLTQKGVARVAIADGAIAYLENEWDSWGEARLIYMQTGEEMALGISASNLWFDDEGQTLVVDGSKSFAFSVADRSIKYTIDPWYSMDADWKRMRLYKDIFYAETETVVQSTKDVVNVAGSEWELRRELYHKEGCYALMEHDRGLLVYDFRLGKVTYALEGLCVCGTVVSIGEGKFLMNCSYREGYLAALDLSGIVE